MSWPAMAESVFFWTYFSNFKSFSVEVFIPQPSSHKMKEETIVGLNLPVMQEKY